jgi:hypothetical protein
VLELVYQAVNEHQLEQTLMKMEQDLFHIELRVVPHQKHKGVKIVEVTNGMSDTENILAR